MAVAPQPMPEVNGTLRQLWLSYHSGVMSASFMNRWLEYADHYEHHLPRRAATGRVVRLLEIGVQSGGSVQMWRDWFGAGFHYVGVDVDARCLRFARPEQQLHIAIGSQLNASFLLSLCRAHGPFDVIIDDAAHMAAHIRRSLQVLFPDDRCMATPSSLYVVEDLHTMMMPNYVELGPSEFDALSSEAFRSTMSYWSPGATRHHPIFGRRVAGVHLYDSIAFIDRGAEQAALTHVKLGKRRASFTDGSLPNRLRKEPAYAEAAGELKESLRQLAAPLPLRHAAQPAWLRQATEATWAPGTYGSSGGCSLEAPGGLQKGDTPAAGEPEPRSSSMQALASNQFEPSSCGRMLLVHNDMQRQGMGWLMKHLATAMLVALKSGRALRLLGSVDANVHWCTVAPFTLDCFYLPSTACPAPVRGGKPFSRAQFKLFAPSSLPRAPMLTMGLSEFDPSRWSKASFAVDPQANATAFTSLLHEAIGLVVRPRAWVRRIGDCVLKRIGLQPASPFVAVFIRDSAEKNEELRNHGHGLPLLQAYEQLAEAVATQLLPSPRIILQTSSRDAFERFASHARARNLSVGYTENPRGSHDTWAGWKPGSEMVDGTVAAVNQYLASRAQYYIGLRLSAWTEWVVPAVMGGPGGAAPGSAEAVLHLCCKCGHKDRIIKGGRKGNVVVLRAAPAAELPALRARESQLDLSGVTDCTLAV